MKRVFHVLSIIALYDLCGLCLRSSLYVPAMITAVIFYVSTYIGIFLGTVSLIIQILEFPMKSKEIIKARQSPAES